MTAVSVGKSMRVSGGFIIGMASIASILFVVLFQLALDQEKGIDMER